MKKLVSLALGLSCFLLRVANAQGITFDFDNAPQSAPLPITLTVSGITAYFSANPLYYNYSIQRADTMGFTPVGFAGLCIYPSSVFRCDLLISLDRALSSLSIMYAPQELATDSSCTMRVTAYYNSKVVATNTYAIPPSQAGTWPTGILSITTNQPFNNVVIHYDQPPPTGGDWGPIFMADNLTVIPWTAPYARIDSVTKTASAHTLVSGVSVPFGSVTVESTDSLTNPFTYLATITVASDGSFQFEDADAPMYSARFYRVTYP